MPLSAGTKLGPYEILAAIGASGMGSACGRGERAQRDEPLRAGVGSPRALKNADFAHPEYTRWR